MPKKTRKNHNKTAGAAADVRANSADVEKAFVAAGSKNTYGGQLVRFVMYIFDHHKEHLVDEHRIKMEDADAKDKEHEKTSKARTKLRRYILDAIIAIQAKRDGQPHNCFIKIEDEEDALSYSTVVEYFNTKFNVHVVDRSAAEAYLKAVHGS